MLGDLKDGRQDFASPKSDLSMRRTLLDVLQGQGTRDREAVQAELGKNPPAP